ncbi:MAG: uracil-DNA glycosylase [Candidatus Gastranaerophilales bacterium]|nr:uracil-DNA glycosylase [Candidatus Gastranaerophilales bacterium]
MEKELEQIRQKCLNCTKCSLSKTRHNVVFSDGVPNNKLVLVGEAPGYYEDMKGIPFVGKAGQLLDKIFDCVGLSRKKDVYIMNTIKCRPPENRNPLPEEKRACREYLDAQLEILKPKIILICGNVALESLLDLPYGITRARGNWFEGKYNSKMMPIYHPSYLLRNNSREKGSPKWQMWQDIKEVKRVYESL